MYRTSFLISHVAKIYIYFGIKKYFTTFFYNDSI